MGEFTKVKNTTMQEIQMNAGIMVDSFTPSTGVIGNILGATTGGFTFNTNPEYEDFGEDIDNVPANTWQLKRIKSYDPAASGNFVAMTGALAKQLSGAGAYANNKITPSHDLGQSDFSDIWIVGDYSDKNYGATQAGFVAIHILNALNTAGFQWTSTKDGKGQFAFDFHGHYDLNNIDTAPYEIYVKPGTGTLTSLTVASTAGAAVGDSTITVTGHTLGSGESYVYQTAATTAPSVAYGQDVSAWTSMTSGSDITPPAGDTKITVALKDSNGKAIGSGNTTLTKKT